MSGKGKLSVNVIANILSFTLSILVGLIFTPYLIKHLGIALFGIIQIAITLSTYLAVLSLLFNSSVGRFVTISLEKKLYDDANKYFNSSIVGSIFFSLLLVACALPLIKYFHILFVIPAGFESDVSILISYVILMVIISILTSPFEVSTFCKNRFDIRNVISIFSTFIKIGLVVVLFSFFKEKVWHIGASMLIATLFSAISSIVVWKKITPELKLNFTFFSKESLLHLVEYGGWVTISQIGTLLLLSIDLFVINRFLGAESCGKYASLLQWSLLLRGIALTIAGVLSPTIMYLYARDEIDELIRYSRTAVKYLGLFIALPVGFVGGMSREILLLWLGKDFVPLAPLLTLMVVPLCINLGYIPLHNISTATNNVKIPGIVQVICGLINLSLAIILVGPYNLGLYGVALAGIIVLTLRNVVFTPFYGARIINRPYATFMKELLPITGMSVLLTGSLWIFSSLVRIESYLGLLACMIVVTIFYAIAVWLMFLSKDDKTQIKGIFQGRLMGLWSRT